jgi:carboxynorspermidine decarboxylase
MIDILKVPSPSYVMEEELLRRNLSLIKSVSERTGVEIILAFKAFAMWKSFPIFREYIQHSTASSVAEAQLAKVFMEVVHSQKMVLLMQVPMKVMRFC